MDRAYYGHLGIVSATFAFIAPIARFTGLSETTVFYGLRLLLGVAEAGFFPGVVYFIGLWFPTSYRARSLSLLALGIPTSAILGRPISGYLLDITAGGLQGWQWLFILEAVPAVILGAIAVFYLTDRPHKAEWLTEEEKSFLISRLEAERLMTVAIKPINLVRTLADRRLLICAAIYFCETMGSFGLTFFLPTIVQGFGASNVQIGFLSALPAVAAVVAMILLGRSSDRTMKRREHVFFAMTCAGVGLCLAGVFAHPTSS